MNSKVFFTHMGNGTRDYERSSKAGYFNVDVTKGVAWNDDFFVMVGIKDSCDAKTRKELKALAEALYQEIVEMNIEAIKDDYVKEQQLEENL